jgi:RNA polymerase sigma-70 factor (ECF subfamily)
MPKKIVSAQKSEKICTTPPKSFFPKGLLTLYGSVLHSLTNPGVQTWRFLGLREIETMAEPPKDVTRWLAAARGGSLEALGQVLEACRDYLLGIAGRRLGADLRSKGGASDLVQQTFLDAQCQFERFRGESEKELLAWLRQILLHNLAHFQRRYRATGKRDLGREAPLAGAASSADGGTDLATQTPSPSEQIAAREEAEALRQALERLSEEHRQVLALRHQEQLTFEEIGRRLGRSVSGARALWLRAVERLNDELGKSP